MRPALIPRVLLELSSPQRRALWAAVWLLGSLLGMLWLTQRAVDAAREAFYTDARIAHRLLSQRAVQHETVLVTLGLMQSTAEPRLQAVYPQFLSVLRRLPGEAWTPPVAAVLGAAESAAAATTGPVLAQADFAAGRFWLLLPSNADARPGGAAYAIEVSLPLMVPWAEWPMGSAPEAGKVRATLRHAGREWLIHAGRAEHPAWRFTATKPLAAASQPFELVVEGGFGWRDLPWAGFLLWTLAWTAVVAVLGGWLAVWEARQRAEQLLRMGQVSRLNALGEMAAGFAHELNQPLTAVLANTQAAARLLNEAAPDIDTAREAMARAAEQGKRAAEVVARLRRSIERPDGERQRQPVDLAEAAGNVVALLAPEIRRRDIAVEVRVESTVVVRADPVALQQVIHNLIDNAIHALESAEKGPRRIELAVSAAGAMGRLAVKDNGPGVAPELVHRLFDPFVSGRPGGLGIGLSLCDTLVGEMDGMLQYRPGSPGAVFVLELPLAAQEGRA